MSPFCAACGHPFVARVDVRLAGSEAVHASCVGRETALQRMRRALADLEPRIALLKAEQAAQHGETTRSLMEVTRARGDLRRAIAEREQANALLVEVRAQRDAAIRERDAARTELATARKSQSPTQEVSEQDERTATEIRFSLLELD